MRVTDWIGVHTDSLVLANPGRAVITVVGDSAEDANAVLRALASITIPIVVR